jgi:hypothetical protein
VRHGLTQQGLIFEPDPDALLQFLQLVQCIAIKITAT